MTARAHSVAPAGARNFNLFPSAASKDEWLTPPAIVKALGPFDLDPCAPVRRPWPTAARHFTVEDDGLAQAWDGRVWLNPPYGRETFRWMARLAEHRSGLALIFARTETRGFHAEIWRKAQAVFFFRGRLKFHHVDGRVGDCANAPSCLVSYAAADTDAIARARLAGQLVRLR